MGEFIRFYSWGLSMKFHMAIYTLALVFFKAIFNALAGEGSVSSLTMLQMLLVSMAVAILESFLFPEGRELEPSALRVRTVWWGLLCNLGFVGGALALGWFSNVPLWGGIFLVLFLEWGLYNALVSWIGKVDALNLLQFVPFAELLWPMMGTFGAAGLFVGIFGSFTSIRRFLDV